ncbi:ATP-dependent DNA ligase [Amylocystis lapponica]|nr:ATP-dependent DNA ligase [Amylocystis lapponica]
MAKRVLSAATGSKSPTKKPRSVAGQSSLDRFFDASSRGRDSKSPAKGKREAPATITTTEQGQGASAVLEDESYAWKIAKQDGLDMETLRKLERTHSPGIPAVFPACTGPSTSPPPHTKASGSSHPLDPLSPAGAPRSFLSHSDSSVAPTYRPLAVDPVTYELDSDVWRPGMPVPYSFLAHALATLSETRSRIAIINILVNALRTITRHHPPSLLPALYLLSNSLSPPYSPLELGLGHSIISKAIQHTSGLTPTALKRLYNVTGDAGDVAHAAKSNVRTLIPHPPLLITGVYESLLRVARAKGQGAAKQKQAIVEKLLVAAKGEETRFLVRTLSQNLRVGAVRTSILTALARAMVLSPPASVSEDSQFLVTAEELAQIKPMPTDTKKKVVDLGRNRLNEVFNIAESLIKKVYVQHPNYDHIVDALLDAGLDGLPGRLPLTIGIPLLPTLGSPTRSLDEIYERLGGLPFTAEFKYDGQRAQIHASMGQDSRASVKIFSRHLEDMTDKYPDVVSLVEDVCRSTPQPDSFIIDAEIVAIDPTNGSIKSFQELSNRARKDVKLDDVKVAVCVFAFDLMYLDGQILLEKPFRERRSLLRSRFPPVIPEQKGAARFDHVRSCESEAGRDVVEEFWQLAVTSSCEGLMVKLLDSGEVSEESNPKEKTRRKPLPATYEPDKRTSAWLKLKKDYVTGLGDSLDLVPIGAWHGNGRKAQWWSPILLAVRDPDTGKLVGVCKCMSDYAVIQSLKERYPENSDTCSQRPLWEPQCETGGLKPQVYFKPQEVWEIQGADITISPVSVAALGLVSQERGLSLRFPRFIRVREDKNIESASTPEFLAKMWRDQQGTGKNRGGADDGELIDANVEDDDGEEDEEDSDS